MTVNGYVFISHAPEERGTAEYLAGDLERQGVRACLSPGDDGQSEQLLYGATALVALASASGPVRRDAERAAQLGRPIHAVRLSEAAGQALAGLPIISWTDAFGPNAQANVARLGHDLRAAAATIAAPPGYPPTSHPGAPGYGAPAPPGRNTGLIIAGSALGGLVLVVGLLEALEVIDIFPSGGSSYSSSSTYTSPSYDSSGGANKSSANSSAPARGVTMDWLSNGSWQPYCGHSTFMTFGNNGVAENQAGRGTYTLTGSSATLSGAGETITFTLGRISENTLSITLPGRAPVQLQRCFPTRSYEPG